MPIAQLQFPLDLKKSRSFYQETVMPKLFSPPYKILSDAKESVAGEITIPRERVDFI